LNRQPGGGLPAAPTTGSRRREANGQLIEIGEPELGKHPA